MTLSVTVKDTCVGRAGSPCRRGHGDIWAGGGDEGSTSATRLITGRHGRMSLNVFPCRRIFTSIGESREEEKTWGCVEGSDISKYFQENLISI